MAMTHAEWTVEVPGNDSRLDPRLFEGTHTDVREERGGNDETATRTVGSPGWTLADARFKRAMDVGLSAALLVLCLPVMLLVVLLIALTSRGGVIFRQTRVGRHGRPFTMLKFRTMHPNADAHESRLAAQNGGVFLKIRNDSRVTWAGRFLRKYSLDELPQLLNVLRGDMSLVGPRPLLPSDLDRFPRGLCERRFLVPPGLTGLWQVSGRSRCSDARRIMLDLEYVERRSLWLDLRILARTPLVAVAAEGAY